MIEVHKFKNMLINIAFWTIGTMESQTKNIDMNICLCYHYIKSRITVIF